MATNVPKSSMKTLPDIEELEARLQAALRPVAPRDGFVHDLHQQLIYGIEGPKGGRRASPQNLLVILASLLGTVMIVVYGARGVKSLMQSLSRFRSDKAAVTITPAV